MQNFSLKKSVSAQNRKKLAKTQPTERGKQAEEQTQCA
jgi:hypothetical protein